MWVLASFLFFPLVFIVLDNGWGNHKHTLIEQLDSLSDGFNHDIEISLVALNSMYPKGLDCNEKLIHQMKKFDYHAKFLTTIGYVRDGNITCTSDSGKLQTPMKVEPASWVTADDVTVTLQQPIPLFDGEEKGITVQAGPFIAFLDYQQAQSRPAIPWLKYRTFGLVDGKITYNYGTIEYKPEHPFELVTGKRWFEDGYWNYLDCTRPSECKVIGVNVLSYFKTEPAAVIFLSSFFVIFFWLFTQLGLRLHQSMYSLSRQVFYGINGKQLQVRYQPIIDLDTQQMAGAEALCRWKTINGRYISTCQFVQQVEKNNQTIELTEAVIKTVIKDLTENGLLGRYRISINAFPDDIASGRILQVFKQHLSLCHFSTFTIELTEQKINDLPALSEGVRQLRTLGFKVAIDDFGTGFSNFDGLRELKIDALKIDKSFIWQAEQESLGQKLVEHIVSIAKVLKLAIVAEGVETSEQLNFVSSLGVDYSQGFYHSRPVDIKALAKWSPTKQ